MEIYPVPNDGTNLPGKPSEPRPNGSRPDWKRLTEALGMLSLATGQALSEDRAEVFLKALTDRYSDDEILRAINALLYTFDGTFGQVLTVAHIAKLIEVDREKAREQFRNRPNHFV